MKKIIYILIIAAIGGLNLNAQFVLPLIVSTTSGTNITSSSVETGGLIWFDGGSAVIERGVCWSTTQNPTIANSRTLDGTGTGTFISFISNLNPSTTYYIRAYAVNATKTVYGSQITITTGTPVKPKTQASSIIFSNVYVASTTISWTRGNGEYVAVFMKASTTGTAAIKDKTTYQANSIFGNGTQVGTTGWYCVYKGIGTSVTVTNLKSATTYIVQAFEYDGASGYEVYNITTSKSNPKTQLLPSITTWNGSTWTLGSPDINANAIINSNLIVTNTLSVKTLTINQGCELSVNPGAQLTASGNTLINGNIVIKSDETGDGSFIDNGSVTGVITVERYLTPGRWHLISPPIANAKVDSLRKYYIKPYNEETNSFGAYITDTNRVLPAASGYAVWPKIASTIRFTGTANTGNISTVVLQKLNQGYNLIGNPFTSPIDLDALDFGTDLTTTIWIWNGTQYATYTPGLGSTNGGSRYVAIGQAFFVQTTKEDITLTLTNVVRIHSTEAVLKSSKLETSKDGIIRVNIRSKIGNDECIIALREDASKEFDLGIDAEKMKGSLDVPQLFTYAKEKALSVNVLNDITESDSLYIRAEVPYKYEYTLNFSNTSGNEYEIIDNATHTKYNLAETLELNLQLSPKDSSDRFVLVLKNTEESDTNTTEDEEQEMPLSYGCESLSSSIRVYQQNSEIVVSGLNPSESTSIFLSDINGRILSNHQYPSCSEAHLQSSIEGVIFVNITNGQSELVKKIIVR